VRDMNAVIGTHDVVLVTLDTLRYDVAVEAERAGRTPEFSRWFSWEERHAPGNFTFALLSGSSIGPGPWTIR